MEIKGLWQVVHMELDTTVTVGDPVRTDSDTGHATVCTAAAITQPLGIALASGVDGDTIPIAKPLTRASVVKYALENAYAATQNDINYALVGTTGAFYVDNNKTDADFWFLTSDRDGCSSTQGWATFAVLSGEAAA